MRATYRPIFRMSSKDNLLGRRGELLREILKVRAVIRIDNDNNPSQLPHYNQTKLMVLEKELTEVDNKLDGLDKSFA